MATYTLPNSAGGGKTIDASSLADAQAKAQAAGWYQPNMGTFGIDSLPPDQVAAAHGGVAPPAPLYTLPVTSSQYLPSTNPASNPYAVVQAAAQANQIPSGPSGSYLVPIANLVAQGATLAQAVAQVTGSTIAGIAQSAGIGNANTGASTAKALTAAQLAAQQQAATQTPLGIPLVGWAAIAAGAFFLLRKH